MDTGRPEPIPDPLQGVRVLDFTWSVAGPTITRILGALGAEVIKVEWPEHPDSMRRSMFAADSPRTLNTSPFFADQNTGKHSLTLDARSPEGGRILRELLGHCDVVAESFAAGVFDRWGLTADWLASNYPSLVYVSVSGFGHSGPYSDYGTWGPTAQAFSGLTFASGLPAEIPAGWGYSYLDYMAGYQSALAVLAALVKRRRTGHGQRIDTSQVEIGISLLATSMADHGVNATSWRRPGFPPGNRAQWPGLPYADSHRGEVGAPYNTYPTRGGGRNDYVVIAVLNDDEWARLRDCLPAEWAKQERWDTVQGRIDGQEELDRRLGEWCVDREKYALMGELQAAGVRCGVVQSAQDRLERDPSLAHREVFPTLEHPLLGPNRFQAVPVNFASTGPARSAPRWPALGSGNSYVLGDLLGYPADEIDRLDREGVTWPAGLDRDVSVESSHW